MKEDPTLGLVPSGHYEVVLNNVREITTPVSGLPRKMVQYVIANDGDSRDRAVYTTLPDDYPAQEGTRLIVWIGVTDDSQGGRFNYVAIPAGEMAFSDDDEEEEEEVDPLATVVGTLLVRLNTLEAEIPDLKRKVDFLWEQ